MKSEAEIKEKYVEIKAELRRLDNRAALGLDQSLEELEVIDALASEYDLLEWILRN